MVTRCSQSSTPHHLAGPVNSVLGGHLGNKTDVAPRSLNLFIDVPGHQYSIKTGYIQSIITQPPLV
jgi:hypothetical protein